jgi:hypothetical protein
VVGVVVNEGVMVTVDDTEREHVGVSECNGVIEADGTRVGVDVGVNVRTKTESNLSLRNTSKFCTR